MNNIDKVIQGLYETPLEASELQEVRSNIIDFFELLIEIDQHNKKETRSKGKQ